MGRGHQGAVSEPRRSRHPRQCLGRRRRQIRAAPRQRREAPRIPDDRRGAAALCRRQLRISGQSGRDPVGAGALLGRAEARSAAAGRDRQTSRQGERAGRQGRLRPGAELLISTPLAERQRRRSDGAETTRAARRRGLFRRRAVTGAGWSAASVLVASLAAAPIAALLALAARPTGELWAHLLANVLPEAARTTLLLGLGVGLATAATGV